MVPAVTRRLAGCAMCLAVLSSTAGAQPIVFEVPSYRFLIKRIGWMVGYGTLGPANEVALRFSFVSLDKKKGCFGPLTVSLTEVRFEAADRTCALLVPRSAVAGVQRGDLFVSATVGGRTLRLHPAVGIPNSVIVLAASDLEQSTMLALLEKSLADFDAAENEFLKLIAADASVMTMAAPLLRTRGGALLSSGRHVEAAAKFEQALAADPSWASAEINRVPAALMRWHIGRGRASRGDEPGARQALDVYLQYDSRYLPYRPTLGLAVLQDGRGEMRDAEEQQARSAETGGDAAGAFRRYAAAYALTVPLAGEQDHDQRLIAALVRTSRAMSPRPEIPEEARRYFVQGEAHAKAERYGQAQQAFVRVTQIAPWFGAAYYNRALVLASLKNHRDAIAAMQRYLEIAPDAPNARAAQDKIYEWEIALPSGASASPPAASGAEDDLMRFFGGGDDVRPTASATFADAVGVTLATLSRDAARELRFPSGSGGVLVTGVSPAGAAKRAGLSRNDIIIEVNKRAVATFEEAQAELQRAITGRTVFLSIWRDGQQMFVTMTRE